MSGPTVKDRLIRRAEAAGVKPPPGVKRLRDLTAKQLDALVGNTPYPELYVAVGKKPPKAPDAWPICQAIRVASKPGAIATYSCGGSYTSKPQIQNHTDYWWGACGVTYK